MEDQNKTFLTVMVTIDAPIEKVWTMWNTPQHIMQWNAASDDWHTPHAENDFQVGGKSLARMEAKDGSFGFDFEWTYTKIDENESLHYTLADDRRVEVDFQTSGNGVLLTERFEPESTNSLELQQSGWQAILNNFKKYVESH